LSALAPEVVLTAIFLIVILGATAKRAAAGMDGLAIGQPIAPESHGPRRPTCRQEHPTAHRRNMMR